MATHKELITALKFDESFKNALRDYYTYGFKRLSDYDSKREQTLIDDWERLNSILADYLEWSEREERKETMFASADSQGMDHNPFQRVYRFCKYRHIAYFFHTMLAFVSEDWNKEYLERAAEKFAMKKEAADLLDAAETPGQALRIITNLRLRESQKERLREAVFRGKCLKTSELALYFPHSETNEKDANKTPNNRLKDLAELGLLECIRGKGKKGYQGERYWKLSSMTMSALLEAGSEAGEAFPEHLRSAVDFYSKYFILGEAGMFLLDRMGTERPSPLRFKAEYFMQSLNDFNLLDLLGCMERGEWCRIQYRHGTADIATEILCFPLEVRISSVNGRETLMYYEPFRRSCTGLRLEFIDSVFCYSDKTVRAVLESVGEGLSPAQIDQDLEHAKQLMKGSWGVSVSPRQEGNVIQMPEMQKVKFRIAYDPREEPYILERLLRERRCGEGKGNPEEPYIDFEASVSDVGEMRPWIRSFYSRIVSWEGIETDSFSIKEDVRAILAALDRELPFGEEKKAERKRKVWGIPPEAKAALKAGVRAKDHEEIFNEIFSIYSYILAEVLVQISSAASFTERELKAMLRRLVERYSFRTGSRTKALLIKDAVDILLLHGFVLKAGEAGEGVKDEPRYKPVYRIPNKTMLYKEVIPLTTVELRWLRTILEDEKIRIFLSEKEILAVRRWLERSGERFSCFPVERVCYFDRYHFPEEGMRQEAAVMGDLLEGIRKCRILSIDYLTAHNRKMTGLFQPAVIEFSKRNNRFQLYGISCGDGKVYTMNVSGIHRVSDSGRCFRREEAERIFQDYRTSMQKQAEILFVDVHNLADRILMEFSPWKKLCTYDEKTGMFRLTIFYLEQDETDLAVRLLGYGPWITFPDKNHSIFREIRRRIEKQKEWIEIN